MSSTTNKQQPYFPHYANSRNEDNMIRLRMEHGVAGYGVYYMLLERLRLSDNYRCELDYKILSWDLACPEDLIRSVIYDFGLFEVVCDGQMFQSVELNAYMQHMEEKKRERAERARAAAAARWGKNIDCAVAEASGNEEAVEISKTQNTDTTETKKDTERLDREIEAIKNDETWLKGMSEESGKSTEEILSYLPDFKILCIVRGIKNGHKNMSDALSHFRSWIYKSGRAKDPNAKPNDFTHGRSAKVIAETSYEFNNRLDTQQAERNREYAEWEKNKTDIRLYIMNKGYDPAEVDMVKLAQPKWMENNPPSHPEWIGKFDDPVAVPY